ncbi:MAG: hypothetical protein M0Z42_05290 [Actinomycetota bacterium]|nr:hypothetical protein [Actinomycetota bacterium]
MSWGPQSADVGATGQLVASDGATFTFGPAGLNNSLGGTTQTPPTVGLVPLTGGGGELIPADGSAPRLGSWS